MYDMFKEQSDTLKEQGEILKELLNRVKEKSNKDETTKMPGLQLFGF